MKDRLTIAVTGGIGSGKSEVCRIIEDKGYPVIYADKISRGVTQTQRVSKLIAMEFGLDLDNSGGFDRKQLADIVFSDNKKLEKLNRLTHPLIIEEMFRRINEFKGLVFAEIPLLFESGTQELFDRVVIVERDIKKRVLSVMERDGLSEAEVLARIKNQQNYVNFPKNEHTVIYNDGNLESLNISVENLLNEIQDKVL